MGKTTITNGAHKFNVPGWVFETGKMLLAAAIAVGLMYIRMASLKKDVGIIDATLVRLTAGGEARQELIHDSRQRIGTMEVKGSVLEKNISEALVRIEADVKETKIDIRELQKRVK